MLSKVRKIRKIGTHEINFKTKANIARSTDKNVPKFTKFAPVSCTSRLNTSELVAWCLPQRTPPSLCAELSKTNKQLFDRYSLTVYEKLSSYKSHFLPLVKCLFHDRECFFPDFEVIRGEVLHKSNSVQCLLVFLILRDTK